MPNVLAGVEFVDLAMEVMAQKLGLPIFWVLTALQRLEDRTREPFPREIAEVPDVAAALDLIRYHELSVQGIRRLRNRAPSRVPCAG